MRQRLWIHQVAAWTLLICSWSVAAPTRFAESVPIAAAPAVTQVESEHGTIHFISEQDGHPEIYTVNTDGSGRKSILVHDTPLYDPHWSPVGRH